jgi:hypothetical protein
MIINYLQHSCFLCGQLFCDFCTSHSAVYCFFDAIIAALGRLFFLLGSGLGTNALGGPRFLIPRCPVLPFAKLSLGDREAILQYWASAPIPLLRQAELLPCHFGMHEITPSTACIRSLPQKLWKLAHMHD